MGSDECPYTFTWGMAPTYFVEESNEVSRGKFFTSKIWKAFKTLLRCYVNYYQKIDRYCHVFYVY